MVAPPAWLLTRLWPMFYFDLSGGWWEYVTRHTPLDFAVLLATLFLVIAIPALAFSLPLYVTLRLYQSADRTFDARRYLRECIPSDDAPAYVAANYHYQLAWGRGGDLAERLLGGVAMAAGTLASAVAHVLCLWLLLKMVAQAVVWSSPSVDFWTRVGAVVLWIVLVLGGCTLIALVAGPRKGGRALRRFVAALFAGEGFKEALHEAVSGDG
jgi:hypothetical protein